MSSYRLGTLIHTSFRLPAHVTRLSTVVSPQLSKEHKPSTELYGRLKENAALLATNEDQAPCVFRTLDEIGYAHLNKGSESDKTEKTDAERFPTNTNQMIYMLQLILDSKTLSDPVEAAVKFSKALVETHLVKLDDIWLRVLVGKVLERNPKKPLDALNAYTAVCESQPFPKVFPGPMFAILMAIKQLRRNEKFLKVALEVLEKQGSTQPHYVEGAVLLANGQALEFLDKLKNADRELGIDELRRLTRLAMSLKEPRILEPLVQLYRMLPKNHEVCQELFNTLAVLYGQKNNIEALEVLWRSLRAQIKGTDWHHYKHVFQRCRHFYRCNNLKPPEELSWVLKKADDS